MSYMPHLYVLAELVAFPILLAFLPWTTSVFAGAGKNHREGLECYILKRYILTVVFAVWGGLALLGGWSARGETLAAMLSQEEAKLGYLFYVVCALVTVNVCNMLLPLVGACCLRAMGVEYEQVVAAFGKFWTTLEQAFAHWVCCTGSSHANPASPDPAAKVEVKGGGIVA